VVKLQKWWKIAIWEKELCEVSPSRFSHST
jgi:hypothetical protein